MEGIDLLAKLSPDQLKALSAEQIGAIINGGSTYATDMAKLKRFMGEIGPKTVIDKSSEIVMNELLLKYITKKFYFIIESIDSIHDNSCREYFARGHNGKTYFGNNVISGYIRYQAKSSCHICVDSTQFLTEDEFAKKYDSRLIKFCEIYKDERNHLANKGFYRGCTNFIVITFKQIQLFDKLNKEGLLASTI